MFQRKKRGQDAVNPVLAREIIGKTIVHPALHLGAFGLQRVEALMLLAQRLNLLRGQFDFDFIADLEGIIGRHLLGIMKLAMLFGGDLKGQRIAFIAPRLAIG